MNRKGFTLIELIITIVLIALMGTMFTTNYLKSLEKRKEAQVKEAQELVERAACTYAITHNGISSVTGAQLIEEGLIEETINGVNVNGTIIEINYDNNEMTCTISGG